MSPDAQPALTRRRAGVDLVLVVLLLPLAALLAAVASAFLLPPEAQGSLGFVIVVQAAVALVGLRALLAWRSQSWRDIGLKPLRVADFGRAVIVLLAGFGANAVLTLTVYAVSPQTLLDHMEGLRGVALAFTSTLPLAVVLALLLLVGLYEELVARGMLLARSRRLLGGYWAPVLLSAVLFGLGHFYQGWFGAVQTAVLGVVLAAFTIRWETLWPAILAHAAINMLSVVSLDRIVL